MSEPSSIVQPVQWLMVAIAVGLIGAFVGDDAGAILILVAVIGAGVAVLSILWELVKGRSSS